MPSPKRKKGKKQKGLDVPLRGRVDDAPVESFLQGDDEPVAPNVLAHYAGPRFFLSRRGACVILSPASCRLTACGSLVPLGEKSFYDRPPVFAELERARRQDVLASLRAALSALRAADLCCECDAAILDTGDAPLPPPACDGFVSFKLGDAGLAAAQARIAEAVVRSARWAHVNGHEIPLVADRKMAPGTANFFFTKLADGSPSYVVRYGPTEEETMA